MLILEPTRELAAQVETAIHDYARFTNLKITVVFGGVGYGRQNDELRAGADIVVATPGRLLDHLEQGTLRLDKVQFLVLDEADRMLDMGFLPDVRRIVEKCPRQRHTALFSATIPPQIETLIKWAMHNPETIEIGARRTPAETVKHVIYPVSDSQKSDLLIQLLERVNYDSVLVFCRTKHGADRIAGLLKRNQSRRRRAAFQPHAARTRAGAGRVFATANSRCSSPRTSPRAASTSPTSATSSTTTCRSIRRITSIASGAPAAPKPPATPSPS